MYTQNLWDGKYFAKRIIVNNLFACRLTQQEKDDRALAQALAASEQQAARDAQRRVSRHATDISWVGMCFEQAVLIPQIFLAASLRISSIQSMVIDCAGRKCGLVENTSRPIFWSFLHQDYVYMYGIDVSLSEQGSVIVFTTLQLMCCWQHRQFSINSSECFENVSSALSAIVRTLYGIY